MRLEHLALWVHDLERAVHFYVDQFQAQAGPLYRNEKTGFESRFLSFDDGARLEIMTSPDLLHAAEGAPRAGYAHLAFSVGSREEVDQITRRLAADGFTVVSGPRTTGDGYYESCVLDPEGNRVEITE